MTAQNVRIRARRALDARVDELDTLRSAATRPHAGWIRAIREALGMTTRELAERMGVTHSTLSRLEVSERRGTIRLDSLQVAADALDCEVVYALVPRRPLDEVVDQRARHQARQHLAAVGHTMALEDQALSEEQLDRRVQLLAEQLKVKPGLWRD